MSDSENEAIDAFHNVEGHTAQFSQAGAIDDLSLNQLRDHIKKVMIPLLIKSFQLKLELSQAISLPSRLQPVKQKQSFEEIIAQLKQLDKDLQVLLLWCQSCRNQIQKALVLPEEEMKSVLASTPSHANPAVSKSFSDAVTSQSTHYKNPLQKESASTERETTLTRYAKRKRWWNNFF
jgi:hypothetical protein